MQSIARPEPLQRAWSMVYSGPAAWVVPAHAVLLVWPVLTYQQSAGLTVSLENPGAGDTLPRSALAGC